MIDKVLHTLVNFFRNALVFFALKSKGMYFFPLYSSRKASLCLRVMTVLILAIPLRTAVLRTTNHCLDLFCPNTVAGSYILVSLLLLLEATLATLYIDKV